MDRSMARDRLVRMVAAESPPTLPDSDVDLLLDLHRVPDADGRTPNVDGYVDTWDVDGVNLAAAEGWRWKAARVAGDFTFNADGASYDKAEVLAHCLQMEQLYASRVMSSPAVFPGSAGDYDATELIP